MERIASAVVIASLSLVILLIAAIALSPFLSNSAFSDTTSVERPEVAVGDSWTYSVSSIGSTDFSDQTYTITVTDVKNDSIKTLNTWSSTLGSREKAAVYTDNWNKVRWPDLRPNRGQFGTWTYSEIPQRLVFPLVIGNAWEFTYTGRSKKRKVKVRSRVRVVGSEEVTVSAGVFRGWKVVITSMWRATGDITSSGTMEETLWYSPEIKRFVKRILVVAWRKGGTTRSAGSRKTVYELAAYNIA